MAEEELKLKLKGLSTAPNPFSGAPDGSLLVGDNLVLRAADLVEPRRGYVAGTTLTHYPIQSLVRFVLDGRIYGFSGDGFMQEINFLTGNPGTVVAGGCLPYSNAFNSVHSAQMNKTLYLTTRTGIQKVEEFDVPYPAGVLPPALIELTTATTAAGGMALPVGAAVSYRAVLARYDTNDYLILGPPCAPFTYTNTTSGAVSSLALSVFLSPAPVSTKGWFVILYRTGQSTTGDTGDECFEVAQSLPITAPATNTISFTDATPDSFLGSDPLYTNANTGDGSAQENSMPPIAGDLCQYRDFMFYANTLSLGTLVLALLGTGTGGLQVGDTITLTASGTVVFTGSTSTSHTAKTFQVFTSGTAAFNIEQTARAICSCITKWFALDYVPGGGGFTGGPISVSYISGPQDNPGLMAFRPLGFGSGGVTVTSSSHGDTAFSPACGTTAAQMSSDLKPARLFYSKEGLPEAVPEGVTYFDVGSADDPIMRIIPLRECCFIFKQRDGVFILTGDTPDTFTIRQLDPTVRLLAGETAVALSNSVFCLSNKGVVAINASGVSSDLSAPIRVDLDTIIATCPFYPRAAFGIGYEDDGLYILALPASSGDQVAQQQYVFSVNNPGWTRWTLPNLSCGLVAGIWGSTGFQLYFSSGSSVWVERKSLTAADYVDPAGAAIACTLSLNWLFAGDPTSLKTWQTVMLYFLAAGFSSVTVTASSDNAGSTSTQTLTGPGTATSPWKLRYDFSQSQAQSCAVKLSLAISTNAALWRLAGLKVTYDEAAQVPQRS